MADYLPRNFLAPFDPSTMKPKDVGLGGPSTEYLSTEYDQFGNALNVPLIWWDRDGNPHMMTPDNALALAQTYEAQNPGRRAPRYNNIGQAVEFAQHRSANGGASTTPLFRRNY